MACVGVENDGSGEEASARPLLSRRVVRAERPSYHGTISPPFHTSRIPLLKHIIALDSLRTLVRTTLLGALQ
jgi:hypothetical protein